MSYPNLTEGFHPGEYIVSEGRGSISRDEVTVGGGVNSTPGTVLGEILIGAETSAAGANTGNGVLGAVTVELNARVGVYSLRMTAANAFELIDPNGDVVGIGATGVVFNEGGLSFTLAAGGTPFVAGDTFTLTVAAASGTYVPLNLAAIDGSQIAAAILFGPAMAASGPVLATITSREAEVDGAILTWPSGITGPQIAAATAQLAKKFIIVR